MPKKDDQDLLMRALNACVKPKGLHFAQLSPTLFHADPNIAAGIQITYRGSKQQVAIQIKRVLHTASIPYLANCAHKLKKNLLVVTSHVTPGQGLALRDSGVQFIDTAGNCYLDVPGCYSFILGQKGGVPDARSAAPSFSAAAVRLLFHYLTDPNLLTQPRKALINRPYRDISKITDVSLGSVTTTRATLNALGFLSETPAGLGLIHRQDLIERWVSAYTARLRPKLSVGRYRSPTPNWGLQVTLDPKIALWGGESAAARLTKHLKPEIMTIYRLGNLNPFILENDLHLDREGTVEILDSFWSSPDIREGNCVHPLLVYADLVTSGLDRNIETARILYGQNLRQLVETP